MNKFWLESWGWFLAIWGVSSWNSLLVVGRKSKSKENKPKQNKKTNKKQISGRYKVEADACLARMRQHGHLWLQQTEFKWSFPALVFHDGFLGGIIVCKKNSALWSGILLTISKKCKCFLGVQKLVLKIQSLWILDQITGSHAVWVCTPQW